MTTRLWNSVCWFGGHQRWLIAFLAEGKKCY
jgi:hypothetical protein